MPICDFSRCFSCPCICHVVIAPLPRQRSFNDTDVLPAVPLYQHVAVQQGGVRDQDEPLHQGVGRQTEKAPRKGRSLVRETGPGAGSGLPSQPDCAGNLKGFVISFSNSE